MTQSHNAQTAAPRPEQNQPSFLRLQLIAGHAIARKETIRILRIWKMTVMPSIITIILFSVVFGKILGQKVGYVAGVDYLQFIVPGLIMNVVINESFSNNSSTIMIDKYNRSIESLITAPVHESTVLISYFIGCVARVFLAGFLSSLLAFWIAGISVQHWFLFIYTILITCALFSFLGFINGLKSKRFDDNATIPTFILTPLSFFGGIFYDITRLPEPYQSINWYNPIVYIVDTFRFSIVGISLHEITESLLVVTVITVILFLISFMLLRTGYGLRQ